MTRRIDYGLLIALAVVAHGLLLLNDGIYWDDWYLYTALQQHNWPAIALLGQRGIPTDPLLYWIIGYSGRVFAFKLVKFVAYTFVALLIYEACLASRRLRRGAALAIAALALTYPGDETPVILMTVDYVVYYAIFWIAVLLGFLSEDRQRSTAAQISLLCASIVCFLISFNLNSLLVFYFGFVIAVFRLRKKDIVLISLPFVFWTARLLWFAPKGYFSSYNRLDLTPGSLIRQTLQYTYFTGLVQANDILRGLLSAPLLFVAVCILAYTFHSRIPFGIERATSKYLMLYSLFLALLAILPYAAVRKAPNAAHGPNTRCEILLAVPIAIFIVAAIAFLFRTSNGLSRPAFLTLMIVLTAFTVQTIHTYVSWQAEWAKERALIFSLAQQRIRGRFATLFVCADDFWQNNYFVIGIDALLLGAWGQDSGVRIDPRWVPGDRRFSHPDELQTDRVIVLPDEIPQRVVEPVGSMALCASHDLDDANVAATYVRDRFFRPEHLPLLYAKLAHVAFREGRKPANRPCCQ